MAEQFICSVCGEPTDETSLAVCNSCGERYHLNERNDQDGKDCGSVWINDQYLALEFACQRCLDENDPDRPATSPAPRVITPREPATRPRRYRRRA